MFSFFSAAASGISRFLSEGVRMMATVHPTASSLVPLLQSLEDPAVGQEEHTDAYLTIANRLSGEDGKHFLPAVVKHFSRLGKVFQAHIVSPNVELCQAALQALGFCVFHSAIVSGIPDGFMEEVLASLNSIVVKSTDKNTCTRALWVMSKQTFPSEVVARKVPDVLKTLEAVRSREDLQSVIMEHEALNVVIRLLEQAPGPMGEGAVQWARLVIPLVVHSASKVRLRAAAALEMGMPLLLQKQQEVAAVIEPLMSSKLIPELQKLFSTKNESNVLKLWPLFVKLLGKLLHRGGPFINSLLHLEELGFRSSSPIIKKIAFIAWKSLIDNFALNPEILCSAKRLKLLMQPLSSIQVRTEALLLTKLEVWWYLVVRLGPNLAVNFEQVGVPLLQIAVSTDSAHLSATTPSRNSSQNATLTTPKTGGHGFNAPSSASRLSLNSSVSSVSGQPAFPSIQLLGLEMLLHYFLGSEVTATATKTKLQLNLEPLTHPLITSPSSFTKHAGVLISAARDSFISIGSDAPEALLTLVWKSLVGFVTAAMEAGSKKDRPGSEVLTLLLQALESIVQSEALPAQRILGLLEATVRGIPHRILGSAAYQLANMDVLNGTPALFLILLFHHSSVLPCFVSDERFFLCLETLIGCGLSGPASPLAFSESVLGVMSRNAEAIQNKEHLWRMWSLVVNPLTDTITQTNEVNQGDALEHNFSAVHRALMFPVTHLVIGHTLPQMTQKSLLSTWSRLYKAFARCSALVGTAEENVCCEELCAKMAAVLDAKVLSSPSTLEATASLLLIVIECVDFSPYTPHYQKTKLPHTPLSWVRKKNKALGNLTSFQALLVEVLESFLPEVSPEALAEGTAAPSAGSGPGTVLIAILSTLFSNLVLGTAVLGVLSTLPGPLARLYELAGRPQNEQPKSFGSLGPKLEKLLGEILGCLQTQSSLPYDDELLVLLAPLLRVLFPHRNKLLRTLVTQFWNATFANAPTLTYPECLKPVLSQVKQKLPIILPGFQAVEVTEDNSGQYSTECSQMETHVSGVKIASVGKRDSLLSRAGELREKEKTTSDTPSKPVAVKLDFGSPKLPRRELLEEAASMDFVFIPPETKERVLTEHQKEVKRTKRVDIPAMYNNLDASLDTTVFTQYSQSQEDTTDKPPANDDPAGTPEVEVQDDKMETEGALEPDIEPIPEPEVMDVGPVADSTDDEVAKKEAPVQPEEVEPKSECPAKRDDLGAEDLAKETRESGGDDCNVSASSDVVSGTPPKPNSRRQSFITLEKYVEGKAASPISAVKFTGPLSRASNSQETSPSQAKEAASPGVPEDSAGVDTAAQELGNGAEPEVSSPPDEKTAEEKQEQPRPREEEVAKRRSEGTGDEDDVIPDTQAHVDSADPGKQEAEASVGDDLPTKDEDSYEDSMYDSCEDNYLYDSQCSLVSSSQSEIRRSGRRRSRPLRPGEDPEEVEGKYKVTRKNSNGKGVSQSDSPQPDPLPAPSEIEVQSQGRPTRRSKVAAEPPEVEVRERLRKTRADSQIASSQASQNDSPSLGRVTRSRSTGPSEEAIGKTASSPPVSQTDGLSQGRSSRRSKVAASGEETSQTDSQMATSKPRNQTESQSQGKPARRSKASQPAEEMSQTDAQESLSVPVSQTGGQSQGRPSRRSKALGPSEGMSQTDIQVTLSTPVSQTEGQSQGRPRRSQAAQPSEEVSQTDTQVTLSTPVSQTEGQSQGRPRRSQAAQPSEEVSQIDTQVTLSTPVSQTEGQSQGRPRRSQAAQPSEEVSQIDTQVTLSTPVSQTEGQSQGRPRRSQAAQPSEEVSQIDTQVTLSTPVSQTEGQSQGRPRRSQAAQPSEEVSQTDTQVTLSTSVSQTESQSQGRPGRRSKASQPSEVMSQNDAPMTLSTPVSQTDSQSQGRPGRRSKASQPSEVMSQNDAPMTLLTPVSQTDSQSHGRPSRRSKVSGPSEEVSQTDAQESSSSPVSQTSSQSQERPTRRSKAIDPSGGMSQTDTPITLSTPVSQTNSQSRGRSRRSQASQPSEEMSQTDTPVTLSTPVSQTDSQSRGRPGRRSKASASTEEISQTDAPASLSTPASQTNSQSRGKPGRRSKASGPSEEMSQNETQASLSAPVNQADAQSQGRLSRSKVAGTSAADMSQTDSQTGLTVPLDQNDNGLESIATRNGKAIDHTEGVSQTTLSTPASQTDSQSLGTPSKIAAELSSVSCSPCATSAKQSEHSQAGKGEGTLETSQNLGLDKTSRFSQGLLPDIENSELDLSQASDDGEKSGNRGRKRKLLKSEATSPSPLKTQQVLEESNQIVAMETNPEDGKENCELSQNSESKSIPFDTEAEAAEPSEKKANQCLTEMMVPDDTVNPILESREIKSASEMQEEMTSLGSSVEVRDLTANRQRVRGRRGRGRPRSRGSNSRAAAERETLSQESGIPGSPVTDSQDLGEIEVSPDPDLEPPSDSEAVCPQPENASAQQLNDAEVNDDVFSEPDAVSTPTVSAGLPTATPNGTETMTGSTATEDTWNTCNSDVQTGIVVSEEQVIEDIEDGQQQDLDDGQQQDLDDGQQQDLDDGQQQDLDGGQQQDMDDGQQQDISVPQVTDVTECTVDPAQVPGGVEKVQEQDMNWEEDLALLQEHNAAQEVVLEAAEEDNVTQIDSDIPAATADSAAIQSLPEEPPTPQQGMAEHLCLDSPPKQKLLDTVAGELGLSPSSGKMKGVWSPSASPSTSILKKGQKRPLEVESPSPLPKSRRVSFADPIQHQELADDIDRRSPVIRQSAGSSPRSKNVVTISSQQKFVTTPTKGMLTLSPRNLRSPGYKSSKKCLISEMSHEPKPIPKDCVYPALVSCSTPVEAVLPQISSNMWPRGFGQLVRARNIRTVGDLSALTPTEIKSLPIRSPKLSNVKKALRNYHEQQRKGRSDELKGFDEMEKMTSEPEETEMAQHQEEGNAPGEQVMGAELADVPAPAPVAERRPAALVSAVESLGARLTPEELGQCSPGQLVLMHEQLGGMMRAIVVQLQTRLAPTQGESIP
ncbi:telomere-associated protein RIF1 isoform X2 [Conger conger]|uniref:telomere-associated protein RIF1 isoform X2 n=1 Tax=Conger conger TaxID=82655 RepID=UPI002A5AEAD3|nr:telomere-associated protein RIF1 isoform X2 [Conger conger]